MANRQMMGVNMARQNAGNFVQKSNQQQYTYGNNQQSIKQNMESDDDFEDDDFGDVDEQDVDPHHNRSKQVNQMEGGPANNLHQLKQNEQRNNQNSGVRAQSPRGGISGKPSGQMGNFQAGSQHNASNSQLIGNQNQYQQQNGRNLNVQSQVGNRSTSSHQQLNILQNEVQYAHQQNQVSVNIVDYKNFQQKGQTEMNAPSQNKVQPNYVQQQNLYNQVSQKSIHIASDQIPKLTQQQNLDFLENQKKQISQSVSKGLPKQLYQGSTHNQSVSGQRAQSSSRLKKIPVSSSNKYQQNNNAKRDQSQDDQTDDNNDYEPQEENSQDEDQQNYQQIPTNRALNGFDVKVDAVEGTKNFEKAYDKLVKKFYKEEGASLLIPKEDIMVHEYLAQNPQKIDVNERQRRIQEMTRKKEEKIRQAQLEKEKKELEECSFAPKINRIGGQKKKTNKNGSNYQQSQQRNNSSRQQQNMQRDQSIEDGRIELNQTQDSGNNQQQNDSREEEAEEYEDQEEYRDVETFVADQNRFLQQKQMKEEILRAQLKEEEEQARKMVPKVNKKSLQLLQQKQERLEQQKLKEQMQRALIQNQQNDASYPLTSRLKKPTSLSRPVQETDLGKASGKNDPDYNKTTFQPQLNKNTDKLLQNRKKRLEENEKMKARVPNLENNRSLNRQAPSQGASDALNSNFGNQKDQIIKASDKYLIQKFNKEFDRIRDKIIESSTTIPARRGKINPSSPTRLGNHSKQFSQNNEFQPQNNIEQQSFSPPDNQKMKNNQQQFLNKNNNGASINYLKMKDMVVQLGLMTEASYALSDSKERTLLYDIWKILREDEDSESIQVENLRVLLQVILKIIDHKRVLNQIQSGNQHQNTQMTGHQSETQSATVRHNDQTVLGDVCFKNQKDQLCVKMNEVLKIQSHFNIYYVNHLQFYKQQMDHKKDQRLLEAKNQNSFKPKIDKSSEILAIQRKIKFAEKIGLDPEQITSQNIDTVDILRAQGALLNQAKEEKAKKEKEEKLLKECTFAPDIKKSKKTNIQRRDSKNGDIRASMASINLDGIARKKKMENEQNNPFLEKNNEADGLQSKDQSPVSYQMQQPKENARFVKLYQQRKRQLDKNDKTKEDYEFERMGEECTFAPKMLSKDPKYLRKQKQQQENQQPGDISERIQSQQNISMTQGMSQKSRQQLQEQKLYDRMQKAREDKLRKNAMFERGVPVNKQTNQIAYTNQNISNQSSKFQEVDQNRLPKQMSQNRISQAQNQSQGRNNQILNNFQSSQSKSNDIRENIAGYQNEHTSNQYQIENNQNYLEVGNQDAEPNNMEDSFDPNEGGPMSLTINNTGGIAGTYQNDFQEENEQEIQANTYNSNQFRNQIHKNDNQLTDKKSASKSSYQHQQNSSGKIIQSSEKIDKDQYLHFNQNLSQNKNSQKKENNEQYVSKVNEFHDQIDIQNQNEQGEEEDQPENQPLLFVDINLGGDEQERIIVYEGDTAEQLAFNFCQEHNLDEETQEKLQELLEQQMAGVLPKIDEDEYGSEDEEEEGEETQNNQ